MTEGPLLYFAYTARISPERMDEVSPRARFEFIAHLPEWGLAFPIDGNGWGGALPTASPAPGSTVWGAVYTVPDEDMGALNEVEGAEGRTMSTLEAIDRTGHRHRVVTHLAASATAGTNAAPSTSYVDLMLRGSRHWSLPAGWIAGLEEFVQESF